MINFEAVLVTIVAITAGILGGRWLSNRIEQGYAGPLTESEAAEVAQSAPTNVEEFLDRYPNV